MRARMRDDDGFTLVELMVTISILSVVMALITGSAIFLQRSINETDQRFDDLAQARLGMDATTKWLRSAITVDRADTSEDSQPFTVARRRRVDFLANIDVEGAAPKRVQLTVVNDSELRERVWDGTINSSGEWDQSGGARTRIIARGLTDRDVFTFFDEEGNDLTPAGNAELTVAEREDIRRVGIAITVQQSPAVAIPPTQLSSTVTLPNQYYFDAEGAS